jgi:hypothetical protein
VKRPLASIVPPVALHATAGTVELPSLQCPVTLNCSGFPAATLVECGVTES